jgi:CRISPR-associated endonuclease Cas3-HD
MQPINANLKLFSFWAKTGQRHDADFQVGRGSLPDFHPLVYHLLDVAACAEALLRSEQPRVKRLAKYCNTNLAELSRCLVALIALHDIGKFARGFQGKVVDLWPDFLGPKPDKELSVRHDAAGLWLFCEDDNLAKVAEKMLPDLCPSNRLKMIQAVCGHHGEPIDTGFGEIGTIKRPLDRRPAKRLRQSRAGSSNFCSHRLVP